MWDPSSMGSDCHGGEVDAFVALVSNKLTKLKQRDPFLDALIGFFFR
jgi:hypothetical protein